MKDLARARLAAGACDSVRLEYEAMQCIVDSVELYSLYRRISLPGWASEPNSERKSVLN